MRKVIVLFAVIVSSILGLGEETIYNLRDWRGVDWYFTINDNGTTVVGVGPSVGGKLIIPEKWDNYHQVVSIGNYAFSGMFTLVPTSVTIPAGVKNIGACAFLNCTGLTSVTIPANVTIIGSAFDGCSNLTNMVFAGNAPVVDSDIVSFHNVPSNCTISVHLGTTGWNDAGQGTWQGFPLRCIELGDNETKSWVHDYLAERYRKDAETVEDYCKRFEEKFGTNYAAVAFMNTGKTGINDSKLSVWQDYVAGTDPTDVYDVFTATITMVEGKPQVQWDPVLVDSEAAKRTYTKYGKVKLTDEWAVIPEGDEANYNFFKVSVKMK